MPSEIDNCESDDLITIKTSIPWVDSMIDQYLLARGTFSFERYEDSIHRRTLWLILILSTFVSSFIFMNMIVSIMGNTFAHVSSNYARSALIERTELYADYMLVIRLSKKFDKKRFLFVVFPVSEEKDG